MKINWHNQCYHGIVLLAVLSRFLPHPPNFTPIGALGLYTGAYAGRLSTWLVPLAALVISDLIIGLYEPVAMLMVYLGFLASMVLGRLLLNRNRGMLTVLGASFVSAVLFFLFSNLGVWLSGTLYPLSIPGLSACFVAALPFFGNTLAGHVIYGAVMFGLFEYLTKMLSNSRLAQTA